MTAVLKQQATGGRGDVFQRVKSEYERRFGLTLGPAFGFNDTFAMEIRGEDARRLNLKTLSQAASYTPHWRAGFGYEFMERPDGYKGLAETYGLRFAEPPRIMLRTFCSTFGLAALNTSSRENCACTPVPVIRQPLLRQHPEIAGILDALANKISDSEMQQMNYAVDGQHRDTQEVVREFLRRKNLVH